MSADYSREGYDAGPSEQHEPLQGMRYPRQSQNEVERNDRPICGPVKPI
jgi:hypothetical protein